MTTIPRHVDELRNGAPFPVKPDTNGYEALSFLVSNRNYGFTPSEIAAQTSISRSSASKTMARLYQKELIERVEGTYYVDPDRADELQQRLESLDAAAKLFESAPDYVYSEEGWEDEFPSIKSPDTETGRLDADNSLEREAEDLISNPEATEE